MMGDSEFDDVSSMNSDYIQPRFGRLKRTITGISSSSNDSSEMEAMSEDE